MERYYDDQTFKAKRNLVIEYDKTIIELGYRKISSIISLIFRLRKTIGLLATDKSRYFA